jgi:hypothetical protein
MVDLRFRVVWTVPGKKGRASCRLKFWHNAFASRLGAHIATCLQVLAAVFVYKDDPNPAKWGETFEITNFKVFK